jgi:hypothetical protein
VRITVTRRAFHAVVQCGCGFRQSVANADIADRVAARHACKPKAPRSRSGSASSNGRSDTNDW